MKKLLSVLLCLLFAASMAAQTGKIRVATVGNSITGERMIMVITRCLWLKCSVMITKSPNLVKALPGYL